MSKFCNTCGLANRSRKQCRLSGIPIDLNKDFCSHYVYDPNTCEICHNPVLNTTSVLELDDNGNWHIYCPNCINLLKTCQVCRSFQSCAFETDPNPLPKVVTKTVRQGNMVMQAQVKNEERVKALCHTCCCWNEEYGCMKEFNQRCDKVQI